MGYEDTMMSPQQRSLFKKEFMRGQQAGSYEDFMLNKQAKISFKAGIEEAQKRLHSPEVFQITEESLKAERQAGRKEVVDYIEEQNDLEDEEPLPYYVMNKRVWQAMKKEWGL